MKTHTRSLWASTTVLIKPWNWGLPRDRDGHFLTTAVGDKAARIDQALKQLPGLFKNPAIKLACMHKSGRTIHNGPQASLSPSMSLMVNTEECTYVRAVNESPTAQGAAACWSPTTTPPKKEKRLNSQPKQTSSHGRGGFRGKKRGRRGSRGGYSYCPWQCILTRPHCLRVLEFFLKNADCFFKTKFENFFSEGLDTVA